MQLSLAHFKCHEEISDSPTTRFRVTLHRCFGEHLESSFRERRPMDDSAHARYTQEEFYAHLEAIESRQIKKVSTHSLVSASHHILSILWGPILGFSVFLFVGFFWSGGIHSQLDIFVTFASILSAQHNFGLRLLFRWHGIGKTG